MRRVGGRVARALLLLAASARGLRDIAGTSRSEDDRAPLADVVARLRELESRSTPAGRTFAKASASSGLTRLRTDVDLLRLDVDALRGERATWRPQRDEEALAEENGELREENRRLREAIEALSGRAEPSTLERPRERAALVDDRPPLSAAPLLDDNAEQRRLHRLVESLLNGGDVEFSGKATEEDSLSASRLRRGGAEASSAVAALAAESAASVAAGEAAAAASKDELKDEGVAVDEKDRRAADVAAAQADEERARDVRKAAESEEALRELVAATARQNTLEGSGTEEAQISRAEEALLRVQQEEEALRTVKVAEERAGGTNDTSTG